MSTIDYLEGVDLETMFKSVVQATKCSGITLEVAQKADKMIAQLSIDDEYRAVAERTLAKIFITDSDPHVPELNNAQLLMITLLGSLKMCISVQRKKLDDKKEGLDNE